MVSHCRVERHGADAWYAVKDMGLHIATDKSRIGK